MAAVARAPITSELRPWVAAMVRIGYAAKGMIYLLIGALALRLAVGNGGRVTDASGVLRTLMNQPFGMLLLATLGVGIIAYAGWQIAQAIWDTRHKGSGARGWFDRSLGIIKGVVYGTVGWEAVRIVLGFRAASQNADDYARDAMRVPLGNWFLALVGMGIAWYGINQMWMAWQSRFDDDLDQSKLRREGLGWVLGIGRWGVGSRGVILTVMGGLLVGAGLDRRPSKAGGMADSLWTLFAQPYGKWLLAITAAGLVCFGVFQLLHARYARLA